MQELESWEETSDGQKWHEENGEEIASQVMSFQGVRQCKDGVNYDYLKDFGGDIKILKSKVSVGQESLSKAGAYSYAATRELLLDESFEDNSSFSQFDWTLECTLTAEIDNRKRTATNIQKLPKVYEDQCHPEKKPPSQMTESSSDSRFTRL